MDIEGILAIILMFGTPLLVVITGGLLWTVNIWRKQAERERTRATFERLTRDKLEVIRTAIAMGRSDDEIRDLDGRLEQLIGTDKMLELLDPTNTKTPTVNPQIMDADLVREVERQNNGGKTRE